MKHITPLNPFPSNHKPQFFRSDDCGIYVHYPYCIQKCPYCDFNSHAINKRSTSDEIYTQAVLQDLDERLPLLAAFNLRSIFLGGGTPSLWAPESVAAIITKIKTFFKQTQPIEITLEANPGAVERGKMSEFKAAQINRISMGVQALEDRFLKTLGRIHSTHEAFDALQIIAEQNFTSHSIDLIYAIPEQTLKDWQNSLNQIASLALPHVSAYNLIYESGTPMANWLQRGAIRPVIEDVERAMFLATHEKLTETGMIHYEISNFARPGHESVHNQLYWNDCFYLGVGAGAHSYLPFAPGETALAIRSENIKNPEQYVSAHLYKNPLKSHAYEWQERISANQRADEDILSGLRTACGWNASNTEVKTQKPAIETAIEIANRHPEWCSYADGVLRPTLEGYLMNDALILACARDLAIRGK